MNLETKTSTTEKPENIDAARAEIDKVLQIEPDEVATNPSETLQTVRDLKEKLQNHSRRNEVSTDLMANFAKKNLEFASLVGSREEKNLAKKEQLGDEILILTTEINHILDHKPAEVVDLRDWVDKKVPDQTQIPDAETTNEESTKATTN